MNEPVDPKEINEELGTLAEQELRTLWDGKARDRLSDQSDYIAVIMLAVRNYNFTGHVVITADAMLDTPVCLVRRISGGNFDRPFSLRTLRSFTKRDIHDISVDFMSKTSFAIMYE